MPFIFLLQHKKDKLEQLFTDGFITTDQYFSADAELDNLKERYTVCKN